MIKPCPYFGKALFANTINYVFRGYEVDGSGFSFARNVTTEKECGSSKSK